MIHIHPSPYSPEGLADIDVANIFLLHNTLTFRFLLYFLQVSGMLMEKELKYLKGAVDSPVRPMACIVGGAKVSSKVGFRLTVGHLLPHSTCFAPCSSTILVQAPDMPTAMPSDNIPYTNHCTSLPAISRLVYLLNCL